MTKLAGTLICLIAFLILSCGGVDTTGISIVQESAVAPSPELVAKAQPDHSSVASTDKVPSLDEALRMIPDAPQLLNGTLSFTNYARIRQIGNIPRPAPDVSIEELSRYHDNISLTGLVAPTLTSAFSGYEEPFRKNADLMTSTYGYNFGNVDFDLTVGGAPYCVYLVLGRFQPERIDRALRTNVTSSKHVQPADFKGTTYYPPLDALGSGIWATPGTYVVATRKSLLEDVIDASFKRRATLGEVLPGRLIAQGMDRLEAVSGTIYQNTLAYSDPMIRELMVHEYGGDSVASARAMALRPYLAYGAGTGKDNKGNYAILIYVHSDEQTAKTNAERLNQIVQNGRSLRSGRAWSERITASEISSEGTVVYAKLWTVNPRLSLLASDDLDSLVLSE